MASQHPDIEKVLFTQEDIDGIVSRLGEQITRDYAGKDLVLIAVLRGAVVFMGDLMRKIELPTNIDFMAVSSYGDGVKSSGIVRIIKDLDIDIRGRDVLIVEDILDSGLTLKYLMKNLESRKPASLEVAAFLWKDVEDRTSAVTPKYVGTHCPDAFVVGYGLDYAERYRNLPYLGILKPEVCPTTVTITIPRLPGNLRSRGCPEARSPRVRAGCILFWLARFWAMPSLTWAPALPIPAIP